MSHARQTKYKQWRYLIAPAITKVQSQIMGLDTTALTDREEYSRRSLFLEARKNVRLRRLSVVVEPFLPIIELLHSVRIHHDGLLSKARCFQTYVILVSAFKFSQPWVPDRLSAESDGCRNVGDVYLRVWHGTNSGPIPWRP